MVRVGYLERTNSTTGHVTIEEQRKMARKSKKFDMKAEIRKLARERVGTVPASRPIRPKSERDKPKHKKPLTGD